MGTPKKETPKTATPKTASTAPPGTPEDVLDSSDSQSSLVPERLQLFEPYPRTGSEQTRAHRTLAKFYYKNAFQTQQTKKKLATACRDTNLCFILGNEVEGELRKFFAGFVKFRFLAAARRLPTTSGNGFIHQLRYTHRAYDAYAILKSALPRAKDNLMYEFRVGIYLNTLMKRFPCFVETYGLFKYRDEEQWELQHGDQNVAVDDLKFRLKQSRFSLRAACTTPLLFAVLVQNIPRAIYVTQLRDDSNLLPILFQIYFPLSYLQDTFTHYDLHPKNVLLYEPAPNKYIEYHYHGPEGTVHFKSNHLIKIIDYGRCYFDDGFESSQTVHEKLRDLNLDYFNNGFSLLHPGNYTRNPHYKCSEPDKRHDLRYFQYIKDFLHPPEQKKPVFDLQFFQMCRDLIPPDFPLADFKGGECAPGAICDCIDARNWLAQALQRIPDRFQTQEKFGDMHVHADADSVFTLFG